MRFGSNLLPDVRRTVTGWVLLLAGCLGMGIGLSGCAVVAVAGAAVAVGATVVKAGAVVVGTAVDVTAAGVRTVTGSGKKSE